MMRGGGEWNCFAALIRMLPATAAAACIGRLEPTSSRFELESFFHLGFKAKASEEAFLDEFSRAPV